MKTIFLTIILTCSFLYGQKIEMSRISLELKFQLPKISGSFSTLQNENGFITGVIFGDDSTTSGVSKQLNGSFLNSFSEYYWYKSKNLNAKETDKEYLDLISGNNKLFYENKILEYSFYPKRTLSDSLLVYCKYIVYTRKSFVAQNVQNYDHTFQECFFLVPINSEKKIDIWDKYFPKTKYFVKFATDSVNDQSNNMFDKLPFKVDEAKIIEFARKSKLTDTKLIMGMELVRINRKDNQIILRRTDFPLKPVSKFISDTSKSSYMTFYSGYIDLPFQIYSSDKQRSFEESMKFKNNKAFYSVIVFPINKLKNKYTFDLIISQGDTKTNYSYSKRIELNQGEKINIELQPDNWRYEEIIDGEKMQLNSEEDYNKFVKDHLILSFETGKNEGQTQTKNESPAKDGSHLSTSKAEYKSKSQLNREAVLKELQEIAESAFKFCKLNHGNFRKWQIPNQKEKTKNGTYRLHSGGNRIIIEGTGPDRLHSSGNRIVIEGTGTEKGYDNSRPVRADITIDSHKIHSANIEN